MRITNLHGPRNFLLITFAAMLLSGCASSFAPAPVTPMQVPIGTIQGRVHGGNLPVSGASIYLYQASTSGYGTAATSLICNSSIDTNPCTVGTYGPFKDSSGNYYVKTDLNGDFSVGGDYMCTQNDQVYMVAVGGNPGLGGTVNNTAIVQMAGLGECPAAGNMAANVPYLVINEVTTVAFAYAMGGFATTPYNVSADSSGATGLANAMANFLNIVNVANGQAYPNTVIGNTNSISPYLKINALANILATCVNQTSSTSTPCTSLFKYATTQSGTQATDEGSAIFNIVHNQALQVGTGTTPTQNATNLYNLMNGNAPFTPYLGSAPTDWTLPVIYKGVISKPVTTSGTITSGPYNLVFDASGDAWIGDRVNGVVEIGPQGAVTTFSNAAEGFSEVKGVAVSPQDGTIWVSDFGKGQIDVMNSAGTILGTINKDLSGDGPISTVFALNPIPSTPAGDYIAYEVDETVPGIVAFDSGSPYTNANSFVHYAGNANSGSDFTNVSNPGWIYVDSTGVVWIPSTSTDYAGELAVADKNGTTKYSPSDPYFGTSYTTVPEQLGMAADGLTDVWAAATIPGYGTGLYDLKAGTPTGTYTGGGLNTPYKTSIDGNNAVWVANGGANTVSGFNSSSQTWLSSTGFSTSAASGTGCLVLAVDPSGDVWAGNSDGSVSQLLGLGTPTAAPLYGGRTVTTTTTTYTNGNLGTKP